MHILIRCDLITYYLTTITAYGYNETMTNDIYSTAEAARLIGVSERQIRFLLKQGQLQGKRMGRDWIVFNLDYKRKRKPKRLCKSNTGRT
jgi:excisionase family DNA binding protein